MSVKQSTVYKLLSVQTICRRHCRAWSSDYRLLVFKLCYYIRNMWWVVAKTKWTRDMRIAQHLHKEKHHQSRARTQADSRTQVTWPLKQKTVKLILKISYIILYAKSVERDLSLRNLQHALRNFKIWPQPDPNHNPNSKPRKSQIAFYKFRRLTNCAQDQICLCMYSRARLRRADNGNKSSSWRWDTRTWRDVSSYLFTYLPRNYDTPVVR